MPKLAPTSIILASLLALSACEKSAEEKAQDAQAHVNDAIESINNAAHDTGAAIQKKADEIGVTNSMESAKEHAAEAAESIGQAAQDAGDAIHQKTNEVLDREPSFTDKLESAADDAGKVIEETGENLKESLEN